MKYFIITIMVFASLCGLAQKIDKEQSKKIQNKQIKINDAAKQVILKNPPIKQIQVHKIPVLKLQPSSMDNNLSIENIKSISELENEDIIVDYAFSDKINILPASVNGTLTPRKMYLNSYAYLDIHLPGRVDSKSNIVECNCGNNLTYVNLFFRAIANERYIITYKVSPLNSYSGGSLGFFTSNGLVFNHYIRQNNDKIEFIVESDETGILEIWSQCSDPNNNPNDWIFHSATIEKIE